jgi:hypothetical protein
MSHRDSRLKSLWRTHVAPLLIYLLVSVAYTWPLVRDFKSRIIGIVPEDPRHSIWLIWHFKEWLLGHDSLFYTRMLYYPAGISTLVDGVGPLSAVFSLPFWHWGPVAAYNGGILIGFWLTGYCMYLCGIGLGLSPGPAIFSGLIYQLLPMHIAAIDGHLEKTFLGLMPLLVLAAIRALGPDRHWRWIPITALLLLGTLLYTPTQFAFSLAALTLIAIGMLWPAERRRQVAIRLLLLAGVSLIITGPLLVALARISRDPRLDVNLKGASIMFEPDLTQFAAPSPYSAVLGTFIYPGDRTDSSVFESRVPWLRSTSEWYGSGMDCVVTIYVTVAILCIIAIRVRRKASAAWVAFMVVFAALSLGPTLRIFGKTWYGAVKPFVMPYGALTTRVPGFAFMRTPARFMLIGAIGLAIVAAIGLQYLRERHPSHGRLIMAVAVALLIVESWPRQWSQQEPPPVSSFYTQIASAREPYAILDLPSEWPSSKLGSLYQYDQLTHRKCIAWGYLSRLYKDYPVGAVNDLMSGTSSGPDLLKNLAAAGYRCVVWHKIPEAPPAEEQFVKSILGDQAPIFEDDLIKVYSTLPNRAGLHLDAPK